MGFCEICLKTEATEEKKGAKVNKKKHTFGLL